MYSGFFNIVLHSAQSQDDALDIEEKQHEKYETHLSNKVCSFCRLLFPPQALAYDF